MTITPVLEPLDAGYQRDPYPHYARLREHPAVWVESMNAWFVGRHADILRMEKDHGTFSHARFEEISRGEFGPVPEGAGSILSSDPPDHTRLRKLANQAFLPGRVRILEDQIRSRTLAALDACAAEGPAFDFQKRFADRIPVEVICEILGADSERAGDFKRWTGDILSAGMRASMTPVQLSGIRLSVDSAQEYFRALIETKRRSRTSDMISTLLNAEEDGQRLTADEILGLSIQLLIGGDETTAHLLSNALVSLWRFPEQLELVLENPELIPRLVEETLRFEAPVQTGFLTTTRAVNLEGVEIGAGDAVIVVWGSANRDPEVFPQPDTFDVTRDTRGHLAFGHGPHFCLGAALARMEAKIILEHLFERFPKMRPADPCADLDWMPSYWLRGLRSLPVLV